MKKDSVEALIRQLVSGNGFFRQVVITEFGPPPDDDLESDLFVDGG